MRIIYKYALAIQDEQLINMPKFAQILDVQVQSGVPCIWAFIDTDEERISRKIITYGTGEDVSGDFLRVPSRTYLATYQLTEEGLVFHVFDGGEAPMSN